MLPATLVTLEIAQQVCDHVLERGGWPDCTAEAILERAESYEELHKWVSIATKQPRIQWPDRPKEWQVFYVEQSGTSYCYLYLKRKWDLVDAMPARLRFL